MYFEEPGFPESCTVLIMGHPHCLPTSVYETNQKPREKQEKSPCNEAVCRLLDEVRPNGQIPTNHGFVSLDQKICLMVYNTLGIPSPSENGNGTQNTLGFGGDCTPESSSGVL